MGAGVVIKKAMSAGQRSKKIPIGLSSRIK